VFVEDMFDWQLFADGKLTTLLRDKVATIACLTWAFQTHCTTLATVYWV